MSGNEPYWHIDYYIRRRILRVIQVIGILIFVIAVVLSHDVPTLIVYSLLFGIGFVIFDFFNGRTLKIEVINTKNINYVFWFNRRVETLCKSPINNKYFQLSSLTLFVIGCLVITILMGLENLNKLLGALSFLIVCCLTLIDLMFNLTWKIEILN